MNFWAETFFGTVCEIKFTTKARALIAASNRCNNNSGKILRKLELGGFWATNLNLSWVVVRGMRGWSGIGS